MMESGLDFRQAAERIYRGGSYGNGSAMRVAPVGLFCYHDLAKLKETAHQSSRITHTHALGMEGAALQAWAVALAVKTEPARLDRSVFLNNLHDVIDSDVFRGRLVTMGVLLAEDAPRPKVIAALGNTVEAFNSVPISIYSFLANAGFAACLDYALSLGGDRDTIAAMTGAIAGACYGPAGIPNEWLNGLENRDYIEDLANRLWRLKTDRTGWWGKPRPTI
jgi:poly(ADP-ribose) glycohydrolase ARH3